MNGLFLHKRTPSDEHGAPPTWNGNRLVGELPDIFDQLPYLVDLNMSENTLS